MFELKRKLYIKLKQIDNYEEVVRQESLYYQHGSTTVYRHSRNVAYYSLYIAKGLENKYGLNFNYDNLIVGAFLHDLFLYDWHEKDSSHRLHGYKHPKIASINAKKMCNVDEDVVKIIKTHMWPLTITKIPSTKEALLVCIADKIMATKEIIDNFKKSRKNKYNSIKVHTKIS